MTCRPPRQVTFTNASLAGCVASAYPCPDQKRSHDFATVSGMSVRMTVRIPDHLADCVDARVRSGAAASRTELVAQALRQLMYQEEREHETAVVDELNARGDPLYPDLDGFGGVGARKVTALPISPLVGSRRAGLGGYLRGGSPAGPGPAAADAA